MGDTADMASEGEAVLDEETIHSNAENDTEVTRLTPAEQAELRIRIAHQVASALQDPRVGRVGFDASTSGSWTSLLTYAGVPGLSSTASFSYVEQTPPPIQPGVLPEVLLSDFDPYLRRTRDSRQEFFESLRGTRRVGSEEHEDHWDTSTSGADDSDAFGISKTIEQTIITSPDDASVTSTRTCDERVIRDKSSSSRYEVPVESGVRNTRTIGIPLQVELMIVMHLVSQKQLSKQ